ncbi:3'-5' exonuclease, partial [Burkholderia cenocepacia]|uniref:3'-5' exonuclease n=1 Tax=Burkholderia cenocepacia TaxID=95486 RepID=UPI00222ECA7A
MTNFILLDTETTGLDESAEIVEIAVIDDAGNVLLNTLVKPKHPIPNSATAIHGITNAMVATA